MNPWQNIVVRIVLAQRRLRDLEGLKTIGMNVDTSLSDIDAYIGYLLNLLAYESNIDTGAETDEVGFREFIRLRENISKPSNFEPYPDLPDL